MIDSVCARGSSGGENGAIICYVHWIKEMHFHETKLPQPGNSVFVSLGVACRAPSSECWVRVGQGCFRKFQNWTYKISLSQRDDNRCKTYGILKLYTILIPDELLVDKEIFPTTLNAWITLCLHDCWAYSDMHINSHLWFLSVNILLMWAKHSQSCISQGRPQVHCPCLID